MIELVEPGEARTPYRELLETRGEVAASLGVRPGRDGFDVLVAHCEKLGYATKMRGAIVGEHPSVTFGAREHIGTDLEVLAPTEPDAASWLAAQKPVRVVS